MVVVIESRTMSGFYNRKKGGRNSYGETSHEAELASRHCHGCQSNVGKDEKGFPICDKRIPLNIIIIPGLITTEEIKPLLQGRGCERA